MSEAPQGANRKLLLAYAESSRDLAAPLQKAFEAAGFDVASCTDGLLYASDADDEKRGVAARCTRILTPKTHAV